MAEFLEFQDLVDWAKRGSHQISQIEPGVVVSEVETTLLKVKPKVKVKPGKKSNWDTHSSLVTSRQ